MYDQEPNLYEQEQTLYSQQGEQLSEQRVAVYLAKVMGWMCVGLLTTVVACMLTLAVPSLTRLVFSSSTAMYGILIAQLVVVLVMSFAANKVSAGAATAMFMVYAALTGVTFTVLIALFDIFSILFVAGLTAFLFMAMAVYGFATKKDLTKVGSLALFGLMGIILGGVVNLFLGNSMLDLAITCIGIVIFIALTAYDTQKIKAIYTEAIASGYDEESEQVRKLAIFGALTLYLDFINLFLKLLRLLGRRRS